MAQDFGDDMGNALLNFVTRQTENYLRFGRGRERAFDWWQRHYKKEGNTPEQAKAMAEKQSSREQVVVPFGTSEEAAYYAQVCRENGTYAAAYTDKQGNGFLAFAKHDFSHRQADILMEAARNPHVSPETLETIADKTLSSGKMRGLLDIASVGKNPLDFRNMDEQTLKAAVSVLFHGGKDLPVTELDLAQLHSVDLALMDGASPAEAMRAAEKSTSAEPEATAASLASEARDAKAARTELDSQSETKDAPTRAEKADGSL